MDGTNKKKQKKADRKAKLGLEDNPDLFGGRFGPGRGAAAKKSGPTARVPEAAWSIQPVLLVVFLSAALDVFSP